MIEDMYCEICRAESTFEQPPCVDGHESDCPEWVCTACGAAVLRGPVPVAVAAAAHAVAA